VAVFVRGGVFLGEGLLCVLGEGDLRFPGSGGGGFSFSPLSGVFAGEVVFFSPGSGGGVFSFSPLFGEVDVRLPGSLGVDDCFDCEVEEMCSRIFLRT
jgi:hypothetical protein